MSDEDVDFRADRMDSPDGYGFARRAWEEYKKASNRLLGPAVRPVAKKYAAGQINDLMGFWLIWHLEGGYEGFERLGMSRSSTYRRIRQFRKVFGFHPDEMAVPGVEINLAEYRAGKVHRRESES